MVKKLQSPTALWLVATAAAFISVLSMTSYRWEMAFRAGSHLYLVLLVGLTLWYKRTLPLLKGRLGRFAAMGGLIFGLGQPVGEVLLMGGGIRDILLLVPGYWCFYTAVLAFLFTLLDKPPCLKPLPQGKGIAGLLSGLLNGSTKSTLLVWGLLFLCWLPYFLVFYPALSSPDISHQMSMALGFVTFTAHHPPLHSAYLGLCMTLGKSLLGSYAAGVALATLLQMLALALLFALTLRRMVGLQISFSWRLAAFLLYALAPVFGWYAVTLWKDVWLGGFSLLFLLCVVEISRKRAAYFRSPSGLALFALASLGVLLSKNNGIYLLLLTMAGMIACYKGCRRQLAAWAACCLLVLKLVEGPVYSALNIQPGGVGEALSVPMLQIGRAVMEDRGKDAIPEKDRAIINEILPFDQLPELYNYIVSDSIKSTFNAAAFSKDPARYAALWLRLGLRYPSAYIRAFLEHGAGYFYPDSQTGVFSIDPYWGIDQITDEAPLTPTRAARWVQNHIGFERNIPGFSMLFSIGFVFWALLFACLYTLYKRRWLLLVPMLFPFAVWLTSIASPVYGSFRYGFPAVTAAPFLLGYLLGRPRLEDPPAAAAIPEASSHKDAPL